MAKFGMSVVALAGELRAQGIAVNALWPRTTIATAAIQNLLGGDEIMGIRQTRKRLRRSRREARCTIKRRVRAKTSSTPNARPRVPGRFQLISRVAPSVLAWREGFPRSAGGTPALRPGEQETTAWHIW